MWPGAFGRGSAAPPRESSVSRECQFCAKRRPSTPSIGSRRQRAEKRLRCRDLGKFRGRRKALKRRREHGTSVRGTAGGIIQSCQIKSRAQLKTARLLLLRDGDCSAQCLLGQRG